MVIFLRGKKKITVQISISIIEAYYWLCDQIIVLVSLPGVWLV